MCIRESVDSLYRDGAGPHIVRVHWKPSELPNACVWSLPKHLAILFQCFPTQRYPQVTKMHHYTYMYQQKMSKPFICTSFCCFFFFFSPKRPTSKVAGVITVIFAPIAFIRACVRPFANEWVVPVQIFVKGPNALLHTKICRSHFLMMSLYAREAPREATPINFWIYG